MRFATRFAGVIVTALTAGWLVSGSCSVSGCYEDCDPCFQQCVCKHVCQNPLVGEGGLRIVSHATRTWVGDDGAYVRVVDVVLGPALVGEADAVRLADFARRVLDVNAPLFVAERDPAWELLAVTSFPNRTAVQFARTPRAYERARANSVTLVFDDAGRLLEATQVVERATD